MNDSLQQFRDIVDDHTLTDQEVKKYLNWSQGNLEQALNYYFRKK